MRRNPFDEFSWEKDGNGYYEVTDRTTGVTVTAIPMLGRPVRYTIKESPEQQKNFYGQTVPKRYNRFEVMAFCRMSGVVKRDGEGL